MNQSIRIFAALVAAHCLFTASLFAKDRPEVVQQLDGFLRPTAAVFSADKRFLYVINHSYGESGTKRGESFLSRLAVAGDGTVSVDDMKFVTNLTAPIDLDFSPRGYGDIPAGALFMAVGTPVVQDSAGRGLRDLSGELIGLLVIDPRTGREIRRIDLSPNSELRLTPELNLLAPSSLCFDNEGNLYIGESGVGGHMFTRRQAGRPGIWRLPAASVERLMEGRSPEAAELIRTTSQPADMSYRDKEDMLYFVTNHTQGRPSGSVFRIRAGKYEGISSMQTIVRELEALSGIQITPRGRHLLVGNSGELKFPRNKRSARPVRFRPKVDFSTPGKIGMIELKDGSLLVAIPEQSSDAGLGRGQRVSMVRLPSDY